MEYGIPNKHERVFFWRDDDDNRPEGVRYGNPTIIVPVLSYVDMEWCDLIFEYEGRIPFSK